MKYQQKSFTLPTTSKPKQWPACGEKGPDGAYCDGDWGHKGDHEGVTNNDEVVTWAK